MNAWQRFRWLNSVINWRTLPLHIRVYEVARHVKIAWKLRHARQR